MRTIKPLSEEKKGVLHNLLAHYDDTHFIYPSVLVRHLRLPLSECLHILNDMHTQGHLEKYSRVECASCEDTTILPISKYQTLEDYECANCWEKSYTAVPLFKFPKGCSGEIYLKGIE